MPIDSGAGSAGPANRPRPTSRAGPANRPRPTPRAGPADQSRPASRPRLAPHVRLSFDPARDRHVLLTPETVTVLNGTGATIVSLCDGQRTVAEIVAELREQYDRVDVEEVRLFLDRLAARRCVEVGHG